LPTSDFHQISDVLHVVEQIRPATVLDIGVGFGKWGMLCREVLEIYQGRVHKPSWELKVEGIEINEPYRNPLWDLAYDRVHIGNALNVLPQLPTYDMAICCDVIEHFDKEQGHQLLRSILEHGRTAIITSPRGFSPQGAIYDNEFERHRSGWREVDFAPYPHLYKDVGFTFMAVLSSDPARLKDIRLLHPLRVLGVKKGLRALLGLAAERLRARV
jgi:hypothetical protein